MPRNCDHLPIAGWAFRRITTTESCSKSNLEEGVSDTELPAIAFERRAFIFTRSRKIGFILQYSKLRAFDVRMKKKTSEIAIVN